MTRARIDLALSWALARNPGGRGVAQAVPVPRPAAARRRPGSPASRRATARSPSCRECGRPLSTGAEKKRGRCADCPASYDEELFERLREWRKERAGEESVPAFVVFTDATLQLIAEHKPRTPEALLRISGIGRSKVEKYGEDVLALVG